MVIYDEIAEFGAFASWNLGDWESMDKFVRVMDTNRSEGTFLNAVMSVHNNQFDAVISSSGFLLVLPIS